MASDWSPKEDLRPGIAFTPKQPEKTARGDIYTWIVTFRSIDIAPTEVNVPCYTQMVIRDCSGDFITTHGRIYGPQPDEDGA